MAKMIQSALLPVKLLSQELDMRYAMVCCGVFLLSVMPIISAAAGEPAQMVCLTLDQPDETPDPDGTIVTSNLFFHELIRQTILNCARDQFGMVTRDATLGEPFPKVDQQSLVLSCFTRNVSGKRVEFEIKQAEQSLMKGVHEYAYAGDAAGESGFADTVYNWGNNDLPQVFEKLGMERTTRPEVDLNETSIPQDVENQLQQLNPFSQFLAVRMTHQEIEDQGETFGRLSALARGYGNLSQLTEYYPLQMRVAFNARGTLCGTRMMHLAPDSPIGYWHRGYVNMLGGLSQTAWWDFEKTESLAGDQTEPEWLPLMKMAYEYDFNALRKQSRIVNDHRELATLLWYRTVEFGGSQFMNITVGNKCLRLMPLSTRIVNGMNNAAGVSSRHMTSQIGLEKFKELLQEKLPDIMAQDDLIRQTLADLDLTDDSYLGLAKIRDALLIAGSEDTSELSAATLARLIDEEVVTTIINRAHFINYWLGSDAARFLNETRPFFKTHPHAPLIETSQIFLSADRQVFVDALQDFQFPVGNLRTIRQQLVTRLLNLKPELIVGQASWQDYSNRLYSQLTFAESDILYTYSSHYDPKILKQLAGWMGGMNPNSPWRHKIYALHEWDKYKDDQEWMKKQGDHPVVAAAIGNSYEQSGEYAEATKWYEKSIQSAPDYATYKSLSEIYWNQLDNEQKALEIAEDFLSEEDFGLSHSTLSIAVTYHLLDRGKTDEAMVWGLRAASAGSGQGYWTLADCHIRAGELEKAYSLYQQSDQRYRRDDTYGFVVRTGHGDLKQARRDKLKNQPPNTPIARSYYLANDAIYENDSKRAFKQFSKILENSEVLNSDVVFVLAELADKLENVERRDELWSLFLELPEGQYPADSDMYRYRELAKLLIPTSDESVPDFETVNQIQPLTKNAVNHDAHYYVGARLVILGKNEQAIEHFRHVVKYAQRDSPVFLYACLQLRELGEDPNQLPQRWFNKTYPTDTEKPSENDESKS